MKRIILQDYWFTIQDGETVPYLIPPDYHVYGFADAPLLLTIRLRSTRSGSAASWRAGAEARKALNSAPYQPVLRALVSEFVWWPPDTARHRPPNWFARYESDDIPADAVCQFGSGVLNFYARVVAPQPDPLRELIAGLLPPQGRLRAQQGRLEVYEIVVPEEQLRLLRSDTHHQFYNHSILGPSRFAYRVIGDRAYGVLVPLYERYRVAVVSPEHLDSPVRLPGMDWYSDADGHEYRAFLLVHPIPHPRHGID